MDEKSCPLCNVINGNTWDSKLLLEQTNNFYVFPGLGSFVEGYLMIVPREHIHSISLLSNKVQDEFFSLTDKWKNILRLKYGTDIVMVESGTNRNSKGKHAHSVVHAHVHLFPVNMPDIIDVFRDNGCPLTKISKEYLKSLNGRAYFMVGYNSQLYICENAETLNELPSQFHRKVVASYIGKGCFYDWRKYVFREEMIKSFRKLFQP